MGVRAVRSLGRLRIPLVILAVVLSVSVVSSAGSLSFAADRQTGLDVAADSSGTVTLDQAASVQAGERDELVDVTNRLGAEADLVISLSAATDGKVELVYNNQSAGRAVRLDLPSGETATISVAAPQGTQEVGYKFEAETIDGTTQRSTSPRVVEVQNGDGPCDNPGNGRGPPRCR